MPTIRSTIVLGLSMFASLVLCVPVTFAAQGLSISPSMLDTLVEPGETYVYTVNVTNEGDVPVDIVTSVRDFTAGDTSGKAVYDITPEEGASIEGWVTVPARVAADVLETVTITAEVTIPQNASVGGNYGRLFFQPVPKEGVAGAGVSTNTMIGMHMVLTVDGEVERGIVLGDF